MFGSGELDVSRLDSNGVLPAGDGKFVLNVSGYFNVRVELFHVTLTGARLGVGYNSETGQISVQACVTFFWTTCVTFSVGFLKPPPGIYLAGNADDTTGTAFAGGELYLNMGPRAAFRNFSGDEKNEFFAVDYIGPSAVVGHDVPHLWDGCERRVPRRYENHRRWRRRRR